MAKKRCGVCGNLICTCKKRPGSSSSSPAPLDFTYVENSGARFKVPKAWGRHPIAGTPLLAVFDAERACLYLGVHPQMGPDPMTPIWGDPVSAVEEVRYGQAHTSASDTAKDFSVHARAFKATAGPERRFYQVKIIGRMGGSLFPMCASIDAESDPNALPEFESVFAEVLCGTTFDGVTMPKSVLKILSSEG